MISTLSFLDKDAKQCGGTSGASITPMVQTSPGTPQRSITPVLEDQIAEQHGLQEMDYYTLDMVQMKLAESPMAQKLRGRKHKQEVAEAVKATSTKFSFLELDANNTGPDNQVEGTDRAEDQLYHESLVLPNIASCVPDQHSTKLDDDEHKLKSTSPKFDTRRRKVPENILSSPIPEVLVVEEAHQEPRSQSTITPSHALRSGSKPDISTKSSAPNQLGVGIQLKIDTPDELHKVFGSLVGSEPAPSSRSRISAARKPPNSSSSLHEDEIHRITRGTVPRTCGRESLPVEREELGSPDTARFKDLASTKDINIPIPRQKKVPKAKKVSKVIRHEFERFHDKVKSSNELKLEILGEVRQKGLRGQAFEVSCHAIHRSLNTRKSEILLSTPSLIVSRYNFRFYLHLQVGGMPCTRHCVKIGKTKQKPEFRISQWARKCNFTCNHIVQPDDKSFPHYRIVEKLVEAELWNMRRNFKCGKCKTHASHDCNLGKTKLTEHGEWYEITEKHRR